MADKSFQDYMITFTIVGLFLVSMFYFGLGISNENGVDDFIDTSKINISGIEENINQSEANANAWAEAFAGDNNFLVQGAMLSETLWKTVWNMFSSVINITAVLWSAVFKTLNIPLVVIGIASLIIVIGMMFAIWRLVKVGE